MRTIAHIRNLPTSYAQCSIRQCPTPHTSGRPGRWRCYTSAPFVQHNCTIGISISKRPSRFIAHAYNASEPDELEDEMGVVEVDDAADDLYEEFEEEAEDMDDAVLQALGLPVAPPSSKPSPAKRVSGTKDFDGYEMLEEGEEEEAEAVAFPEPPKRVVRLADLFARAGLLDIAQFVDTNRMDVAVHGLQNDASRVLPGDLFFCHPSGPLYQQGEPLPADLAIQALQRGAVAVVAEDEEVAALLPGEVPVVMVDHVEEVQGRMGMVFYEQPSANMSVVGITGTAGKTTVSWLVRGVLEEMGERVGLLSSLEWALDTQYLDEDGGLWWSDEEDTTEGRDCSTPFHVSAWKGRYRAPPGCPDSLQIQKLLAGIHDRGGGAAVFEATPVAVAQGRVDFVSCRVAVFTCLGKDATGLLGGDEEMHLKCCLRMFEELEDPEAQRAVVNADDPNAQAVLDAAKAVPCITYSLRPGGGDVYLEDTRGNPWETELLVSTPAGRMHIVTPLLGAHNAANVLAAVATGIALGAKLDVILRGIEAVEVVPGRCEVIDEGQPFPVLVDAAATPEALEALLTTARQAVPAGRIFLVMGCQGDRDRSRRPFMGEVAHIKADYVLLTNDSPRTEDPHAIIQDIVAGFPEEVLNIGAGSPYWFLQDQGRCPLWFEPYLQSMQQQCHRYVYEDRWSAIRCAIGTADKNDIVVIAGRGADEVMEYDDGQGKIIQGWFDDRVEARNALSKLPFLYQLDIDRSDLPWGNTLQNKFDTLFV